MAARSARTAIMRRAVADGLISEKNGNRLDPQGAAARAERAAILMRFCENTANNGADELPREKKERRRKLNCASA